MKRFDIKTEEEADIILHSYRMKIIHEFAKCKDKTATFKQIADRLGDNSSKVTYHGKKLIDLGVLVLDHTANINGITAKYYRMTADKFYAHKLDDMSDVVKAKLNRQGKKAINSIIEDYVEKISNDEEDKLDLTVSSVEQYITEEQILKIREILEYNDENRTPGKDKKKTHMLFVMAVEDEEK